jgi:hypothetical protein
VITLNKIFEVPVFEVKFVKDKKTVSKAVFYGYYLTDDVVFFACEGIGKFQYRFYLRFGNFAIYPLCLVLQDLSPVEMEFRYGFDDSGVSE